MNKAQREPYLILNNLSDECNVVLCCWCKYAEWIGGCGEAYPECKHPLEVVKDRACDDAVWGSDCWAFRPEVSREDAVDVVGIWLRGEAVDWNTVPKVRAAAVKRGLLS